VKVSIAFERASHVNSGTSVDPAELPWPETEGRVMRHPRLHLESDPRGEMTHYGGLVLAQQTERSTIWASSCWLKPFAARSRLISLPICTADARSIRLNNCLDLF